MPGIEDKYGRTFKTLRVSLLNTCNLGCVYCTLGDGNGKPPEGPEGRTPLSPPELLRLISRLHGELGLGTVRLTGGEPLLYRQLTGLVAGIRQMGIPRITLTTNGFLLQRLAASLKTAGMDSVNVSLDAVDEEVFRLMSRRSPVRKVIEGIDAAIAAGLDVKINAVVMRGMNDSQILPLLEFAFSRNISIRFLELMAMGHLHDQSKKQLFTRDEILEVAGRRYRFLSLGRSPSSTAHYWQTEEGHRFGIIANESEPFCQDCDRLRLDSRGNIFGCLSSNHPIDLRGPERLGRMEERQPETGGVPETGELEDPEEGAVLRDKLLEALAQKQAVRFTGSDLSMLEIGG